MDVWRKKYLQWLFKTIVTLFAVLLLKIIEMVILQRIIHGYLHFPISNREEFIDIVVLALIMIPFIFIVIRQKKTLQESQEKYKVLAEDSLVGIYTYHDGKITYANNRFLEITGYKKDEIIDINICELVVPEDRLLIFDSVQKKLHGEELYSALQVRGIKKDRSIIDIEVYATVAAKGGTPFIMGSVLDITEQKQNEKLLGQLAFYDPLTALPNRRFFEKKVNDVLFDPKKTNSISAVIFMDLDGFKQVNDSFGHHTGDLLLKEVAIRLSACVRIEDTVSRLGGDEFLILLPNVNKDRVINIATRIIKELNTPFTINLDQISISTSIGIAFYPDHGDDPETLIRNADMAMYQAKINEKNTYHILDEGMVLHSSY